MFIKNHLEVLEKRYTNIKNNIEKSGVGEFRGGLVIAKNKEIIQYYHAYTDSKDGKRKRVYLSKDKSNIIKALAQKQYNYKVYKIVEKRLRQLRWILKEYEDNEIELVYDGLSLERKNLVYPFVMTYEDKVKEWKKEPYKGNTFAFDSPQIFTKKGERVRSKSEKIMADRFYDLGIEYKYECPLHLNDGSRIYPDFTFLSPITGEEIYWEHHGMIDDANYATNMIKKISTYEKNGIFRGENLIITYELSKFNLDSSWLDLLINKFLKA